MREKLIELLDKAYTNCLIRSCKSCIYRDKYDEESCEDYLAADYLIANGVTIQKWIPVTERLPEDGVEVLIYCGSYRDIGWYESKNKSWRSDFLGDCTEDVTHWMPLPKPPKEK